MKILLLGKNGMVGSSLVPLLPKGSVALSRKECDLTSFDPGNLPKADLIINAAAYTNVKQAETEDCLARRINSEAPKKLSRHAKKSGALLVHFSTDYVFSGEKQSPYIETDPTSPLNVYGKTKAEGEGFVLEEGGVVIRTSWLYALNGNNFLTKIWALSKLKNTLEIVSDEVGSPTTTEELSQYTMRNLKNFTKGSLYHASCQGFVSRFSFAEAILKHLKKKKQIEKMPQLLETTREKQDPNLKRPKFSALATIREDTLSSWDEALEALFYELPRISPC